MGSFRARRTDAGTVFWHWLLVVLLVIASGTGLRIAAEEPSLRWLVRLDPILPRENLWLLHVAIALGFTAALCGYAVYVVLARLTQRTRLDRMRLAAMVRAGPGRWAALGVVVLWIGLGAFVAEIASGLLLYCGYGDVALPLHRNALWICIAFPLLHIVLHLAYGGLPQLLRIVRPARLVVAPAEPDILSLLADHIQLVDEMRRGVVSDTVEIGSTPNVQPSKLPPILASLAVAGFVLACGVALDRTTTLNLVVPRVSELGAMEKPVIDGDVSDPIWAGAAPVTVLTEGGANFGGSGYSRVEIRAVHDLANLYLAVSWDDPTRSLKQRPLIKRTDGWHVVQSDPNPAREETFSEDQFSILISRPTIPIIGAAIHLAAQPLPGIPQGASGRGLHYTAPGGLADVWVWRAAHGGLMDYVEDAHFSAPAKPTPAQIAGRQPYAGGFASDDGEDCYLDNTGPPDASILTPLRLPRDLARAEKQMGDVHDTGEFSEEEGTDWWLTLDDSQPFSTGADAAIPVGTLIPGVVVACMPGGDLADVHGIARWSAGRWTVELVRRLDTGSPQDVQIASGDMLWVAAFDHAATRHTHHVRPITLELE